MADWHESLLESKCRVLLQKCFPLEGCGPLGQEFFFLRNNEGKHIGRFGWMVLTSHDLVFLSNQEVFPHHPPLKKKTPRGFQHNFWHVSNPFLGGQRKVVTVGSKKVPCLEGIAMKRATQGSFSNLRNALTHQVTRTGTWVSLSLGIQWLGIHCNGYPNRPHFVLCG